MSLSRPGERLTQFHKALSTIDDSLRLLETCVWTTTARGYTCEYSADCSFAQNLDTLQQELAKTSANTLAICAINTKGGHALEPLVPWYVLEEAWWYLFKGANATSRFQELLKMVLLSHWPDTKYAIADIMRQVEDRPVRQLELQLKLPSLTEGLDSIPHDEPSFHDLDITLEWISEHHDPGTFLGSQDWGI